MTLIIWRRPLDREWDVEFYDSISDARKALTTFQRQYPWNSYYLATVQDVITAQREWSWQTKITNVEVI